MANTQTYEWISMDGRKDDNVWVCVRTVFQLSKSTKRTRGLFERVYMFLKHLSSYNRLLGKNEESRRARDSVVFSRVLYCQWVKIHQHITNNNNNITKNNRREKKEETHTLRQIYILLDWYCHSECSILYGLQWVKWSDWVIFLLFSLCVCVMFC